jgi:hypothetical protein
MLMVAHLTVEVNRVRLPRLAGVSSCGEGEPGDEGRLLVLLSPGRSEGATELDQPSAYVRSRAAHLALGLIVEQALLSPEDRQVAAGRRFDERQAVELALGGVDERVRSEDGRESGKRANGLENDADPGPPSASAERTSPSS